MPVWGAVAHSSKADRQRQNISLTVQILFLSCWRNSEDDSTRANEIGEDGAEKDDNNDNETRLILPLLPS